MQGNGDLLDTCNRNCSCDRSPTWPLGLTDLSFFEQFATPHTPRLGPVECSRETFISTRALRTDRLGALNVDVLLGEEQVRQRSVAVAATQWRQDELVM